MSTRHLRISDKQILIEFYKVQWHDIKDMNSLDWRVALILIPLVGAFSGVVGILSQWARDASKTTLRIENYAQTIQAFALVIFMLCLYGLWTVAKNQGHTILKFKTIDEIERQLEILRYSYRRKKRYWGRRIWPVFICRRLMLYIVYTVLGTLSLSMVIFPIGNWTFLGKNQLLGWIVAILGTCGVAIGIFLMHLRDYTLHESDETH